MAAPAGPAPVGIGSRKEVLPGPCDGLVAADMVGVGARVDQIADRPRTEFSDGIDDGGSARGGPGVDHHRTVDANLHGNVAARAHQHVEIGPQLKDLETALARARLRLLLGGQERDSRHTDGRSGPDRPHG